MKLVRQAHMPGNYELYDPSANKLGPVICKICWERFKKENPEDLSTVWVSYRGRQEYWWLCLTCTETLRAEGYESAKFLKSSQGIALSPGHGP